MEVQNGVSTTISTPSVQTIHTPTEMIIVMGRVQKPAVHLAYTAWRWTSMRRTGPRIWQPLGTHGSIMMVAVTKVGVVLVWTLVDSSMSRLSSVQMGGCTLTSMATRSVVSLPTRL